MAEQEIKTEEATITFRGKEYFVKDLSPEANRYVEQILDLEKKIRSTGLELDQYHFANEYFNEMLFRALEPVEEEE